MEENELFYARKEFQLQIRQLKGVAFQDFFTKIMQYSDSEFESVKPWGNLGDRKNDGFIKSQGKYFQVYAPEDPTLKIKEAINKLKTDFEGLYEFWESKYKIKQFFFVFNDAQTNPLLENELSELSKTHPNTKFDVLLNHQLEEIFIKLPKSQIQILVGGIPSSEELLKDLDYSLLPAIITKLLDLKFDDTEIHTKTIAPDFDEKIKFNKLHRSQHYLNNAYFQLSKLKEFFSEDPEQKELLKNKFVNLYNQAKSEYPDDEDLQFHYILSKVAPDNRACVKNVIITLMTLYFESCDIFNEPK
ncbi:MAG: hypothetical protein ACP5N2_03710 [Candidatus Nanoarchaeia archaeon]